jgi:hypothetical protein
VIPADEIFDGTFPGEPTWATCTGGSSRRSLGTTALAMTASARSIYRAKSERSVARVLGLSA